jgi:hypothetical protein
MSYEERIGESKLHVLRDGVRFLRTIFEMSLMWQPARIFAAAAVACITTMIVLAAHPLEVWLASGRLREDMIYRLLFCCLLGAGGISLLSTATICDLLQRHWDVRPRGRTFLSAALDRLYTVSGCAAVTVVALPALTWLAGRGVWTRLTAGYVDLHWSRVVLAGLIAFCAGQMMVTVLVANLVRFHTARARSRTAASSRVAASTADVAWAAPKICTLSAANVPATASQPQVA